MRTSQESDSSKESEIRKIDFAEFRANPSAAFHPEELLKARGTHRWGVYLPPPGKTLEDLGRYPDGRFHAEVHGDGNVYDHQFHQGRIIREYAPLDIGSEALVQAGYVKRRPLDFQDAVSLAVCAHTHDLGELTFGDYVGDVKHLATHTVEDEIRVTRSFVRKNLMEDDPRRARRFERVIMAGHSIDYDKSHRLYGLFKLYEKYSYLNGAIAAYDPKRFAWAYSAFRSEEERSAFDNRKIPESTPVGQPHWLVHNVFKNQIEALVRAADAGIPSTQAFLSARVEMVTEMFAWVGRSGFTDAKPENETAFESAKEVWSGFLERHDFGKR